MFFLLAVIIGLIIGFVRGGRLSNLGNAKLSFWIPGILGALLFILWHLHRYIPFLANTPAAVPVIGFAGYVLLMVALIFNLDSVWAILMMVGTVADFVVTFINGGKMPVLESIVNLTGDQSVIDAVIGGTHASYGLLTVGNSTLWFLGVNVPIPIPIVGTITNLFGGMPGLSIGSMVLLVGLVGWISHQLVSQDFRKVLLEDLSSDANNDFILDEEKRLTEVRLAGDYVEKDEPNASGTIKETDNHLRNGDAKALVSEELFKRDSGPVIFSEKPDYFEQVHALQTGELLVTDIEDSNISDESASGKTEIVGAPSETTSEKNMTGDKTEIVPIIQDVSVTTPDSGENDFISPQIKPRAFIDDDTKVISSLRDLKNAENHTLNSAESKQETTSSRESSAFESGRQGQGHAVDFGNFDNDDFEDNISGKTSQNEKTQWKIPEANQNGFIVNQNDDTDSIDEKSDEYEPAWVLHPTYQKGKTPKEKISYKKNPYRKTSIQEGNTMKKDDNKKSEQDMMNVWHQMAEDNQAIRHKRRRKNYDDDGDNPFAQPPKNTTAQKSEQKSSERADYSHYEQASAAGRRKQAEQAKQAEAAQRAAEERPKQRRSTDEERRRAGFEKVEVNVDGRIVTFWRKRKNK